ncbi:MAG: AzlD domain-containing protein [Waddliaceae bacterium]
MTVIQALIALSLLTAITRMGPLLASNWLRSQPWIKQISAQLPAMILVLLLIHQMENYYAALSHKSISATIAIIATLLVQHWRRQMVISIGVGILFFIAIERFFV